MSHRRYAAVDTGFLLGLAIGDPDCEAALDWLSNQNIYPFVTSTPLQELADMCAKGGLGKAEAHSALVHLATWGILRAELRPVERGICEQLANTVMGGASRKMLV